MFDTPLFNTTGNAIFTMADATGRIVYTGSVPGHMLDVQNIPEGGCRVDGAQGNPATEYVVGGAVVPRPANPTVLDGMTLKNLPVPCAILFEGVEHECTDSTCELSASHPGTYTVIVGAWPMVEATFEVTQA
jgi:hypothetical protein